MPILKPKHLNLGIRKRPKSPLGLKGGLRFRTTATDRKGADTVLCTPSREPRSPGDNFAQDPGKEESLTPPATMVALNNAASDDSFSHNSMFAHTSLLQEAKGRSLSPKENN